jgi:LacI family transcriptional regulator
MSLEQVARRAKVSTMTVSRVLNHPSLVKTSTRARVIRAIGELNYHPNLHASNLANGQNRTLGLIVSNLENAFFFDIYRAIEQDAQARGFEVLVANTSYQPEQLVAGIRLMIGRRVAGLAVIVSEMEPALIKELSEAAIPTVFFDVGVEYQNITNIRVDYRHGIGRVLQYLQSLGHRRIGFIGHHAALVPINQRVRTLRDALIQCPTLEVHSASGTDSLEGGRQAARALLSTGFQPTALICGNDITAIGALRELRERGLRVPQDVSVTGFDNVKLSEFCYPPSDDGSHPPRAHRPFHFEPPAPWRLAGGAIAQRSGDRSGIRDARIDRACTPIARRRTII